jgi:tRNA A37 threonylcarbamoyladenosine synthetase subunit TsaC/SUA5/YrdC
MAGGGGDFAAKGRPVQSLIVHVADLEEARRHVDFARAQALARRIRPGARPGLAGAKFTPLARVSAGLDLVALRTPSHPAAIAPCRNRPSVATFANQSQPVTATTAAISPAPRGKLDLILTPAALPGH